MARVRKEYQSHWITKVRASTCFSLTLRGTHRNFRLSHVGSIPKEVKLSSSPDLGHWGSGIHACELMPRSGRHWRQSRIQLDDSAVLPKVQLHTRSEIKEAATVAMAKLCSKLTRSEYLAAAAMEELRQATTLTDGMLPATTAQIQSQAWFAVFTKSHHEKKAAEYLRQQQIDHYLPLYSQVRQWTNRRKVTLQLPLFPNYLFVRIDRPDRGRVLRVPGVLSIVGPGSEATPLPEFEIESLRAGLHLRRFQPHPYLTIGSKVRITVGPLEGMEGILVREKSHLRVVLTVALINQSVAVEVDACDIEPISRPTSLVHAAS